MHLSTIQFEVAQLHKSPLLTFNPKVPYLVKGAPQVPIKGAKWPHSRQANVLHILTSTEKQEQIDDQS